MTTNEQEVRFPNFKSFVCPDDYVTTTHKGVEYRATIRHDNQSEIDDDDSHNPDQSVTGCNDEQFQRLMIARKAWFKDEWWYGWIQVTAFLNGYRLKSWDCLSRIEVNYPDSINDYLSEVATDLLTGLIVQVNDEIDDMREMLEKRTTTHNTEGVGHDN